MATGDAAAPQCAHIRCRQTVPARSTGRPARFCSTGCRQADHRGRRAAAQAAERLVETDRRIQEVYQAAVRALGAVVDAARFDLGPAAPSPQASGREARTWLAELERLGDRMREDQRTAAVYGLAGPASQTPGTVAVRQMP